MTFESVLNSTLRYSAFGMLTIQVFTYYKHFPQDRAAYKAIVSAGIISGSSTRLLYNIRPGCIDMVRWMSTLLKKQGSDHQGQFLSLIKPSLVMVYISIPSRESSAFFASHH